MLVHSSPRQTPPRFSLITAHPSFFSSDQRIIPRPLAHSAPPPPPTKYRKPTFFSFFFVSYSIPFPFAFCFGHLAGSTQNRLFFYFGTLNPRGWNRSFSSPLPSTLRLRPIDEGYTFLPSLWDIEHSALKTLLPSLSPKSFQRSSEVISPFLLPLFPSPHPSSRNNGAILSCL